MFVQLTQLLASFKLFVFNCVLMSKCQKWWKMFFLSKNLVSRGKDVFLHAGDGSMMALSSPFVWIHADTITRRCSTSLFFDIRGLSSRKRSRYRPSRQKVPINCLNLTAIKVPVGKFTSWEAQRPAAGMNNPNPNPSLMWLFEATTEQAKTFFPSSVSRLGF